MIRFFHYHVDIYAKSEVFINPDFFEYYIDRKKTFNPLKRVSGFSRLVYACKSRIKCCKSVHEEPDVSHAPKLGPESFYLGIE